MPHPVVMKRNSIQRRIFSLLGFYLFIVATQVDIYRLGTRHKKEISGKYLLSDREDTNEKFLTEYKTERKNTKERRR
jgi:hypothetical protein